MLRLGRNRVGAIAALTAAVLVAGVAAAAVKATDSEPQDVPHRACRFADREQDSSTEASIDISRVLPEGSSKLLPADGSEPRVVDVDVGVDADVGWGAPDSRESRWLKSCGLQRMARQAYQSPDAAMYAEVIVLQLASPRAADSYVAATKLLDAPVDGRFLEWESNPQGLAWEAPLDDGWVINAIFATGPLVFREIVGLWDGRVTMSDLAVLDEALRARLVEVGATDR